MPDYDVLIVGGGPVGAAAALALRGTGLAVGLVEARAPQVVQADPRPIARIHVSQRGGFGRVELDAAEVHLPALGYVVDYGRLAATLAGALEAQDGCRPVRATVSALESGPEAALARFEAGGVSRQATTRLLVVAEGGTLPLARMRIRDYGQSVVTARVASEVPHRNVAYERFTPDGPLALLPMGERLALVWTTNPERAQQLCEMPESGFLEQLQYAFGGRLGSFSHAGARSSYPLALKVADRTAEPRVVALGNAAQTLHPVAGQGLNLGLRDAWELAESITGRDKVEIGGSAHLKAYRARRRLDRRGGIGVTDALVRLFSNDIAPLRLARGLGLAALGAVPPARDFLVRRMTFGSRG